MCQHLFLWDKPDEVAQCRKIAEEQAVDGVLVAHAGMQAINKDPARKKHLDIIRTPDFRIIDGKWAFLHFLDSARGTASARLTNDERIVRACMELLRLTAGNPDFNSTSADPELADHARA
jgi:hypothetical protein